jgi:hypothetical protein
MTGKTGKTEREPSSITRLSQLNIPTQPMPMCHCCRHCSVVAREKIVGLYNHGLTTRRCLNPCLNRFGSFLGAIFDHTLVSTYMYLSLGLILKIQDECLKSQRNLNKKISSSVPLSDLSQPSSLILSLSDNSKRSFSKPFVSNHTCGPLCVCNMRISISKFSCSFLTAT